jgi:uncharacterized protein YjiS (DUF1127 family)
MSNSIVEIPRARRAGLNSDSWSTALARPIKKGIAWIGDRRRLRRHFEELRALDNRTLRDIGLSRSELEYGARYGRSFDRCRDHLRW